MIPTSTILTEVPRYKSRFPGDVFIQVRRNPLDFLGKMATLGDCSYLKAGPTRLYMLNHPDLIREVLVTKNHAFKKER